MNYGDKNRERMSLLPAPPPFFSFPHAPDICEGALVAFEEIGPHSYRCTTVKGKNTRYGRTSTGRTLPEK